MKLYKKLFPMLIAAIAFTACGEQDAEDYQKGSTDALGTYGNIYFPQTSYSTEMEPTEPTTYEIPVSRTDSTNAVTVPIEIIGSDAITSTDAVFAAGQASTTITLSFPNAVVGTTYTVYISAKDVLYLQPCTFSVTRVQWNLVATGTYTYNFFFEGDDAGLEVYQRGDKPELFKIGNVLGGVDFIFTWNQSTNEVTFDKYYAGFDYSTYGDVYVSNAGNSYFDPETNVFYFNNKYTVAAGSFGNSYETFTLDSPIE